MKIRKHHVKKSTYAALSHAVMSPGGQHSQVVSQKKRRRLPLAIKLLIGLLAVMLLLCITVFILWFSGRQKLQTPPITPTFPSLSNSNGQPDNAPVVQDPVDNDDAVIIQYHGKYYRYNDSITNILLIGVDSDNLEATDEYHQSDLIVLAVLDQANKRVTLLNIPRDTMCDMEVIDENGQSQGTRFAQITLAYAYGRNDTALSAELCRNTVSSVLCGVPIHAYGAMYMDGIAAINDALGGVTVQILDDYPFPDMPSGQVMTLNGDQAYRYVHHRQLDQKDRSMERLARQKQYMLAMINQAKAMLKAQPSQIVPLYRAVEPYTVTDLSLNSLTYLSTQAVNMSFSGDVISLAGEMFLNEETHHAEYMLDQAALYETVLSIFYTEVE